MTQLQRRIKRAFDLVGSIVGLSIFWPIILLCVVVARLDIGMSGIFSQERVGLHGTRFNVYKIRSMRYIQDDIRSTITAADDARLTSTGARLRRYKLDELPQLWNVLIGDMSFVGPRPDVPGYADQLSGDSRKILSVRPGITGPATIKYRDEEVLLAQSVDQKQFNDSVIYPDKVRINLNYIDNWSLLSDFRYILMTVGILKVPAELKFSQNGHEMTN